MDASRFVRLQPGNSLSGRGCGWHLSEEPVPIIVGMCACPNYTRGCHSRLESQGRVTVTEEPDRFEIQIVDFHYTIIGLRDAEPRQVVAVACLKIEDIHVAAVCASH